ncbi:MAG: carboxypeptidase-like regulatory domain-containing protein [Terracidiphilus sp.]
MRRFLAIVVAFASIATIAHAQETRATLTGRVTDPTGAIVPNAPITVADTDTGAKTIVKSDGAGVYTAPFLTPGTYELSVALPGFKTYVHTGLVLETEQTVTENIVLAVGQVDQTVTVSAATPLVDTADATTGQTLTAEEVEDLPSNGRSPLGYAHLEYGAVAKGKHSMSQVTPFGNSTADDFSLGGGASSSNELLLNGVPNMEDSSRTAGYSPELDAVDAVHVDEFAANAALGDTSGGFVNITTKGGTNELHGSGSEYYNGSRPFEALPYFTSPGTKITSTHFNQFAGTIGGPVYIPHLYHGRDKLFFFYAFEGYIGNSPVTTITSVPTAAERQGDFSALLGVTASDQLYNPYQGSTVAGQGWIRPAIPNNCLTATSSNCTSSNAGLTIDPVAAAYMKMIPMPNYDGASTKPDGEDNYYAYDPTSNNYKSNQGRFDYNVSDSDKIFAEGHRSQYNQTSADIFNTPLSGSFSSTILWGGQVDNVKTFSPSLNLETRLGFSRYESFGGSNSLGLSPTSLGFEGYLASNSTALGLPYLTFSDGAAIPSLSANPSNTEYFDDIQLFSSLNKTWGRHSLKFGADIRSNKDSALSPGAANGSFTFNSSTTGWMVQSPNYGPDQVKQPFGSAFALFELGLAGNPSSGGAYNISQKYQYDNWYTAFFAQDDWKALHNLTVSIGLRVEHETPLVESNNKMVSNWSPKLTNVTTTPAETAYSGIYPNYSTDLYLPSSISPVGGIIYATGGNRSAYYTGAAYLSPRIGFSYSPDFSHNTLAIRGGAGIYVSPFNDYTAGNSYGFTQSSNMVTSTGSVNGGYTPITTFDNPFPNSSSSAVNYNPIQPPLGSYYGANTNLGSSIGWYAPVHVPYAEKINLDVQKQFAKNWLVEIGGIRVLQIHNTYTNAVSSAPFVAELDHTPNANSATASAVSTAMAKKLTNPFVGTMPGYTAASGAAIANTTGLNTSSTVTVSQMLQAYPEYSSLSESLVPGTTLKFNALMLRVHHQMAQGLEFDFNYEYSRQLGTTAQLNAGGPLWYGETTSDFPNHASLTVIYQLPFGRGRTFLNNSTWLDEAVGGWELTSIYQYLSGTPISWGNANYSGAFSGFNNNPHDTHSPSFNTTGFDKVSADQPGSWNFRTFPEYLLRSDPTNNFDFSIMKNFTIWERVIVQPRVDAFNALNHAQMSSANVSPTSSSFADVSGQLNTNRTLQGGIHIRF